MAHVRTYDTNVKIGNWNEDLRLREDAKKAYQEKKDRGELAAQKVNFLKENILRPVTLSMTRDGNLHFGDIVMLVNLGGENRECSAVSVNADIYSVRKSPSPAIQSPCGISAGRSVQPCTRTAFVITSVDDSPEGSTLCFEQSFALKTTSGFAGGVPASTAPYHSVIKVHLSMKTFTKLYLTSDRFNFQKCAKKSHLQEVVLDDCSSFLSWWKVVHLNPQERLENEGQPVPANTKVLIMHCKTNQALAALGDQVLWTTYGREYEVTAHTFLDSHKAEQDNNHWILCTSDAGNELVLFNHPKSAGSG